MSLPGGNIACSKVKSVVSNGSLRGHSWLSVSVENVKYFTGKYFSAHNQRNVNLHIKFGNCKKVWGSFSCAEGETIESTLHPPGDGWIKKDKENKIEKKSLI